MGEVVQLVRAGLVGAAGLLGREVLAVLERRKVRLVELVPIGSDASIGDGVEFQGEDLPLRPPDTGLDGLSWVFLCAPAEASREHARRALHARVPALDLSGGFLEAEDVPLVDVETLSEEPADCDRAPLVSVAGGPALAWARVLAPLDREAGLRRASFTALESASTAGHRAFSALSTETIALLSQQEAPEPEALPWPLAFDVHAASDEAELDGRSAREASLLAQLRRLLREDLEVDCSVLRIPTFTGEGAVVRVETERPVDPAEVAAWLSKTPGVEVASQDRGALRTRAATGRESVVVGRIRATHGGALQLWLAADTQRLTAANAVRLAERRVAAPAPA